MERYSPIVAVSLLSFVDLVGILTFPEKETQKIIILAHGFSIDKDELGRFAKLAEELTEAGFATLRFDFRYHGESGGDWEDFTVSGEVADLRAAVRFVKSKGFEEIGILGASFGGPITIIYSADDNPKALCLWNPILSFKNALLEPVTEWGKKKFAQKWKGLEENGFIEVNKKRLGKKIYEEMKSIELLQKFNEIKCPTLIIHGDKDSYVPYTDSLKYYKMFGGKSELFTIEGAEHGFHTKEFQKKAIQKTVEFFKKSLSNL